MDADLFFECFLLHQESDVAPFESRCHSHFRNVKLGDWFFGYITTICFMINDTVTCIPLISEFGIITLDTPYDDWILCGQVSHFCTFCCSPSQARSGSEITFASKTKWMQNEPKYIRVCAHPPFLSIKRSSTTCCELVCFRVYQTYFPLQSGLYHALIRTDPGNEAAWWRRSRSAVEPFYNTTVTLQGFSTSTSRRRRHSASRLTTLRVPGSRAPLPPEVTGRPCGTWPTPTWGASWTWATCRSKSARRFSRWSSATSSWGTPRRIDSGECWRHFWKESQGWWRTLHLRRQMCWGCGQVQNLQQKKCEHVRDWTNLLIHLCLIVCKRSVSVNLVLICFDHQNGIWSPPYEMTFRDMAFIHMRWNFDSNNVGNSCVLLPLCDAHNSVLLEDRTGPSCVSDRATQLCVQKVRIMLCQQQCVCATLSSFFVTGVPQWNGFVFRSGS